MLQRTDKAQSAIGSAGEPAFTVRVELAAPALAAGGAPKAPAAAPVSRVALALALFAGVATDTPAIALCASSDFGCSAGQQATRPVSTRGIRPARAETPSLGVHVSVLSLARISPQLMP